MRLGVTMPMVKQPMARYAKFARAAEDAGLDSLWAYEVYENPFVVLGAAAAATERIGLGTAVAAALPRTPFEMANAAADVNELSGGRMSLGVGLGIPVLMQTLHGAPVDQPLARMRDYVTALRYAATYLDTAEPVEWTGEHYAFVGLPNPLGARHLDHPASEIPIYVGAMQPKMTELAGEIGDGLMGGGYSPDYIRDHVQANLATGTARAGRTPDGVDVVTQVICCVDEDRDEALRRARIHVGQMVCNPVQAGILGALGLQDDAAQALESMMAGGPPSLADVTSDRLVEAFALAGTPDEVREQLGQFEGLVDHVVLHPPYVAPFTADEAAQGFHNILSTFGGRVAA